MKHFRIALLLVVFLLVSATAVLAEQHAVKIKEQEGVGTFLTDAKGMTLYWFKKDAPGKSECYGPCVARWPVYYREKVTPPDGIPADDFGTITRDDGAKQTTFRGYPLYYWVGDSMAGDTTGNMVGNVWFVIDPENFPPK